MINFNTSFSDAGGAPQALAEAGAASAGRQPGGGKREPHAARADPAEATRSRASTVSSPAISTPMSLAWKEQCPVLYKSVQGVFQMPGGAVPSVREVPLGLPA